VTSVLAVSAIMLSMLPGLSGVARAATGPVTVSLNFDDEFESQYALGYLDALQPHHVSGTFYVNSGIIGSSSSKLTWAQLSEMAGAGNEIGGKTVDGTNLTTLTAPSASAEICNDRQALIAHGLGSPISFAYPFGAKNAAVEGLVAACGYGTARTSGSLSPSGPRYSGPNPPDDYYAVRAWAPSSQITLAQLESIVTGAYSNPGQGGFIPIAIQRVCDQTLDPDDYASCQTGAWIQLSDLNAFLDWVQNAGQSGGAPAGTTIATNGSVVSASDVTPPVTTIACNGAPCVATPYEGGTASVSLAATDAGSGVSSTHYTLDESTPTLSSPVYTGPFSLGTGTQTVEFRSWDNQGNAESANTQVIQVAPVPDTTPPTTTIACNGAPCLSTNYTGGVTVSLAAADNPGGTGVANTYYTIDGTNPTTSSPVYTGPFMLAGDTTVKFFSVDNTGNAEADQVQQLVMTPYPVTVSLTFDDQYENQWLYARPLLLANHMHATFYVITSDTDSGYSCCMSWSQLDTLASEGNDIGGHGVNHLDLTDQTLTLAQKTADVCGSRTDLINNGIGHPSSYAYPFGDFDSTAESIVSSCGYQSARAAGGISPSVTSPGPPWAEGIPPSDPFAVKAIDVDGNADKSLADLESFVTAAAINGGGWVPMVFHQVCDASTPDFSTCMSQYGVRDTVLSDFMSWLSQAGQSGGAPTGTTVQTVARVINSLDTTPPTTAITCNGAACSSGWYNGGSSPVTVALQATDTGGSGVAATYYTTDGSPPTTSSTLYAGPFAVSQTTTVRFFSVDVAGNAGSGNTQTIRVDAQAPSSAITCNAAACSAGWYRGSVTVRLSATDTGGSGVTATYYTTNGSAPTTSSPRYTVPFIVTATATVKFFSIDAAGNSEAIRSQLIRIDRTAPTTTISCNGTSCSTGWYRTTPVTVTLTGTDNSGGSGVAATYYTTNGSAPTTSSAKYTGPFTVSQTTTVRYFSVDVAGNAGTAGSRLIRIDAATPTVSITRPAGGSTFVHGTRVTITATATDRGTGTGAPSGIASVTFYRGGTQIVTDTLSPYSITWNTTGLAAGTYNLTAVATDVAGNVTTSATVTIRLT